MALNPSFQAIVAEAEDRRDAFADAGQLLDTSPVNIEKDFWVCMALDVLYNGMPADTPRMLFKGGTSLSKAFGLISRFSEDIDVTVFRTDLGLDASIDELEAFGSNQRRRYLDGIKEQCAAYIAGPFASAFTAAMTTAFDAAGASPAFKIETDDGDPDGQTLLFWYPSVDYGGADDYIRKAVKIESGAKSALDPHVDVVVKPYVADVLPQIDLSVPGVTTIQPVRTFWDKMIIAHGQRRWFDIRGSLKGGGHRVTRHYYDIFKMIEAGTADEALADLDLGLAVQRHARMFFNQTPLDLATATPGTFTIVPADGMLADLAGDYERMKGMIFGPAPAFSDMMDALQDFEIRLNAGHMPSP